MNIELIVAFFILHFIICIAYILLFHKDKKKLAIFPIVLCLPYLWMGILLVIYLFARFGKKKTYEIEGVFKETPKMEYITEFDEEKERNVVPVEEALLLNEKNIQRSLVMEVAKRDPEGYLTKLKRALLSDDTETAHYAASSITELKRGYDKRLMEAERVYKRNPALGPSRKAYIEILSDIIRADLTIEKIKRKHVDALCEALEYDIEISEKPSEASYEMLIENLIKLEKYDDATGWLTIYQNVFPTSDRPLRQKLLLAYQMKDNALFKRTIGEVESAKFPITKKTLEMIEFWRGAVINGQQAQ